VTKPNRGSRTRIVWGPCVLAGTSLLVLAIVLMSTRSTGRHARAVAVVNVGQLNTAPLPTGLPPHARVTQHSMPTGSRLALPGIGLDASISDVRTVGNVMQVPRNPRELGWWLAVPPRVMPRAAL
jgi:hypothetical protein